MCFHITTLTNLFCLKFLVSIPFFLKTLVMVSHEELHLNVFFKGRPVAADDAIMGNHWLENAAVVVSLVFVVGRQYNVAAFVADEVFVVRWNQEVFPFAETTGATIVGQIEFPAL